MPSLVADVTSLSRAQADNRVVIRFADESRIVALIGEAEPAIGEGEGDGGPSALAEAVHQIDVSLCCYDAFLQREAVDVCMCQGSISRNQFGMHALLDSAACSDAIPDGKVR